jgi:GntR family transcriptional regulator, transcriptional repressor for pyruvate dehydrogenase complex
MAAPATEAAINAIRQLIIDGTLPSGSRLPAEHELAAQLGLSRNTLREAVRALITARVLDVRRGDGTFVTSLEPQLLLEGIGFAVELMQDERALELLELRRILEPAAAALAAIRISPASLAELGACLADMEQSHGEPRIMQDIDFHSRIALSSGNQTLATMLSGLSGKTVHARIWHGTIDAQADQRAHDDHEAIYSALANGDPMLAESAALVHVANTERWYRQMLEADAIPSAAAPARQLT